MMRHVALLPAGHLVHDVELGASDLLTGIQHPVRAADKRLLEVDRIVHDRDDRQVVAMTNETLGHRRQVAVRDAVALQPAGLQMRREDCELFAVPSPGREAGPRMGHVCGRMRPAVEPDQARRLTKRSIQLVADRLLGDGIEFPSDSDVGGPTQRIRRRMRLGLMLAKRENRGVPAVGFQATGVVERKTGVVAELRSWNAVGLILVIQRRPLAPHVPLAKAGRPARRISANTRKSWTHGVTLWA